MRKHFIRLLTHAHVNGGLASPSDGILAVTEGEKLRLVDEQGVAEDLTDEFDPEDFPAEDGAEATGTDTETTPPAGAEGSETQKPKAARKSAKTKG